ncbi:MAG: thioesterase family protein [Alphaproteobacteria bacterium]
MKIFYEGRVEPAHIDNLGHMNVRIYAMKAATATNTLAAALGLNEAALQDRGAVLTVTDTYTRHYREQLEGAPLAVRAGVLDATPNALTLYLELFNTETGDLSATFRNVATLATRADRSPLKLPDDFVTSAHTLNVDWPDHGKPRSLNLDPMRADLTLADMERLEIPVRFDPHMIEEKDCGADGFLDLSDGKSIAFMSLPIKFEGQKRSADRDEKLGIATMESRQVVVEVPRIGDEIVTHSTNVEVREKLVQFRNWSFNANTGALVAINASVGLGFNIAQRKAVPFPPNMRKAMEEHSHPELA